MKYSALAAHFARATPRKGHIVLPLVIMAMLFWLSSVPGKVLPEDPAYYAVFQLVSPTLQNALHVPVYAVLAWAWHWALGAWMRKPATRALCAFMIASGYGVFDEWHQSFVPGRFASLTDVALDVAGAALGVWLAVYANRWATRKLKKQA